MKTLVAIREKKHFDHTTEIFKALSDRPSLRIELSVQSGVIFPIDSFFIGQMFPCA